MIEPTKREEEVYALFLSNRGSRMAWMVAVSETVVKTKATLKAWLAQELPLIAERAALVDEEKGER